MFGVASRRSCLVWSCLVSGLSCLVLSRLVVSCLGLSCLVLPCVGLVSSWPRFDEMVEVPHLTPHYISTRRIFPVFSHAVGVGLGLCGVSARV